MQPRTKETTMKLKGMKLDAAAKGLVERIAASWSRAKDVAQPGGLLFDVQFALGCSYGRALCIANAIRCNWPVS
jgi:hypothetical protein